jgi:hypothetical protein
VVIFAVLADPTKHVAIDRTGWVREPLDRSELEAGGDSKFGKDAVEVGTHRAWGDVKALRDLSVG